MHETIQQEMETFAQSQGISLDGLRCFGGPGHKGLRGFSQGDNQMGFSK